MQDDAILQFANGFGLQYASVISPPAWGQGKVRFLQLQDGSKLVVKEVAAASALQSLPLNVANELFDVLHQHPLHLCLPNEINGAYVHEEGPRRFMVFPWLGGDVPAAPQWSLSLEEHVKFIATMNKELASLPESLLRALKAFSFEVPFSSKAYRQRLSEASLFLDDELCSECDQLLKRRTSSWERDCFSQLTHGDLQTSNIVRPLGERLIAIDVDNFTIANRYSDFIFILASRGADESEFFRLSSLYEDLYDSSGGSLNSNQLTLAFHVCLGYMATIVRRLKSASLKAGRSLPDAGLGPMQENDLDWLRDADPLCLDSVLIHMPRFRQAFAFLLREYAVGSQ